VTSEMQPNKLCNIVVKDDTNHSHHINEICNERPPPYVDAAYCCSSAIWSYDHKVE